MQGAVEPDGGELLRWMAARDPDAFSRFYDRYAPLVYPLILRIVGQAAEAADVLQGVFWEAWVHAASYDPGRGSPEAWIVVRARARAIDQLRSIRRRSAMHGAASQEITSTAGAAPGPESAADRVAMRRALDRLPGEQREVIELAYYGGLTQTEIAEQLKQPLGTVKTRIRLGLERLRQALGPPAP
jgi:RNA polymerase sigma-70 factor (ECF subfamily)